MPNQRLSLLSEFPEFRHLSTYIIELIEIIRLDETRDKGGLIASFLLSFLSPDYVCNLSMLSHLSRYERTQLKFAFDTLIDEPLSPELRQSIINCLQTEIRYRLTPGSGSSSQIK